MAKKLKKPIDRAWDLWYNDSTSVKGFFLCAHFQAQDRLSQRHPNTGVTGTFQREVHRVNDPSFIK